MKSITADLDHLESGPFLEVGLDKGIEALGRVTNYTSKEVRR